MSLVFFSNSMSFPGLENKMAIFQVFQVSMTRRNPDRVEDGGPVVTLCLLMTTIYVFNPLYLPIKSLFLGMKILFIYIIDIKICKCLVSNNKYE